MSVSNEEETVMYCIVGGSGVSCVDVCCCFGSDWKSNEGESRIFIVGIGR